ncbi:MAG: O-antigen ligase family protein [Caldilinea sp.]|nr:O-antigen ligase family protein [Caldilinea sp.]
MTDVKPFAGRGLHDEERCRSELVGETGASSAVARMLVAASCGFVCCFLVMAAVGVWAAYDGAAALSRFLLFLPGVFFVLIAAPLGARCSQRSGEAWLVMLANFLALGVALLYLFSRGVFVQLIEGASNPLFIMLRWSDNQTAQTLAITLPFTIYALWLGATQHRRVIGLIGAFTLVVVLGALLITGSRGAGIGVASGLALAFYLLLRYNVVMDNAKTFRWRWFIDGCVVLLVGTLLAFYIAIIVWPSLDAQLGVSAQGGSAFSRIALWRETISLIPDYFYTGSGLASTAMVYSTYAYLVHVPYLSHAHNLYLQVALEQGIPGLIAWLGLVATTLFYVINVLRVANSRQRMLVLTSLASLIALSVHGLFEADLYFSSFAAIVFFAPASALWSATMIYRSALIENSTIERTYGRTMLSLFFGVFLPVLLVLLAPGAPARWEANLGAVMQTRAELSIYRWPEWSFQDQVRRQAPDILAPAESHFGAALTLDPLQPTAHRRLGEIALAQGDLIHAREHLSAAYAVAPHVRATRQLLGEIYALDGDVERTVQLWKGLDMSQGQLMVREWWYEAFGEPEQLERLTDAIRAYMRTG